MSEHEEQVSYNHLNMPTSSAVQFHAQIQPFVSNFNVENVAKRVGMPPAHPHAQPQLPCLSPRSQGSTQPVFFSVDSLPPLSPCSYQVVGDVNRPPRKTHRRSNSDVPFGFSTILQSSPPLIPLRKNVKQELSWEKNGGEGNGNGNGGEVVDDWFTSYVNVNNLGKLNSFRTENREDLDTSDNEATSSVIGSGICSVSDKKEGVKRSADGDIATTTRHYRSLSVDSVMGKIDESLRLQPSPRGQIGKLQSTGLVETNADAFSLEFGNGVFNGAEIKKIMTNENLAEMALADPKRVKRILANRQSAARSKERKMRYIGELEVKVQTLQAEATTLSTQVTLLQRDLTSLTSQNSELKFRVQAMEQQAHLRDALNDTLTAEVQRLKIMRMELSADATNFSHLSIDPQLFHLQHQQDQHEHAQEQKGDATTNE